MNDALEAFNRAAGELDGSLKELVRLVTNEPRERELIARWQNAADRLLAAERDVAAAPGRESLTRAAEALHDSIFAWRQIQAKMEEGSRGELATAYVAALNAQEAVGDAVTRLHREVKRRRFTS